MIRLKQCGFLLFPTTDNGNLRPSSEKYTIKVARVLSFMAFVPENLHFFPSQCIMSFSVSGKRGQFDLFCTYWLEWHLYLHIFVVTIFSMEPLLSHTLPLSYHFSRHEGWLFLFHDVGEYLKSIHLRIWSFQYLSWRTILHTFPEIIAMIWHILSCLYFFALSLMQLIILSSVSKKTFISLSLFPSMFSSFPL